MELIMNKETLEGKLDQAAGAVKQKVGEAFHDQSMANSGAAEQVKGAAKETWGKAKDVAKENRAEAADRSVDHADSARDKIVNAAQNLKENVNKKLDEVRDRHKS
jgi:uncharacterized protein YjbJ (UPF0337 family)